MAMEIIETKKGGPGLLVNNYKFRFRRKANRHITWLCCTESCNSTCRTDLNSSELLRLPSEHNHRPLDDQTVQYEKMRKSIKRKALERRNDSAGQIVCEEAVHSSKLSYEDFKRLTGCANRARLQHRPTLPNSWRAGPSNGLPKCANIQSELSSFISSNNRISSTCASPSAGTQITMTSFYGIGVMSGSSLDGLDLCYAEFTGDKDSDVWGYRIDNTVTVEYDREMMDRLANATNISALELVQLNHDFSHYLGKCLLKFIESKVLCPDFIASPGHIVFHQPDNSLTFCLGDGEILASYVSCPVVSNFRSKDIALGGQGGPLIPNGEKFLFQQTDICLNLGGIANIGCHGEEGFDICPSNMILNYLAGIQDPDLTHDKDGAMAASGKVIPELLQQLNSMEFYQQTGPRTIGSEWVSANVKPLLKPEIYNIPDLLRTYVQHIAELITLNCVKLITKERGTVLATGGGTYNLTLMNVLREHLLKNKIKIVETDGEIVEYKEALVMAFLGLRSLLGSENVFSNVTGSRVDCIAGAIHHGVSPSRRKKSNLQDQFNFMIRQKNQGVTELRIIKDK